MYTVAKQYPQGIFCWVDYGSTDVERSKAFYMGLMGWAANDSLTDEGVVFYTNMEKDGHVVAGHGEAQEGAPSSWTSYVAVDDIAAVCAKAEGLGAKVVAAPMQVYDEGHLAVLQDPTGAYVGLWQAGKHIGARMVNTVGCFCWNELYTRDPEASKAFYAALFGWTYETDETGYVYIKHQGRSNGAIFKMTDDMVGVPPHWLVYFTVADIHATVAQVEAGGGKLSFPISEAAGGTMHICVVMDAQGAPFALIQTERVDPWED